jgi:hypothetical protein
MRRVLCELRAIIFSTRASNCELFEVLEVANNEPINVHRMLNTRSHAVNISSARNRFARDTRAIRAEENNWDVRNACSPQITHCIARAIQNSVVRDRSAAWFHARVSE